jgi:small subunit ribosomal protein S9
MAKIEETVSDEVVVESYSTETPAEEAPRAPRAPLNVPGAAVGRRRRRSPACASLPVPARSR